MPKRKIEESVSNIKYSTKKTKKILIDELNELKQQSLNKENNTQSDNEIISSEEFAQTAGIDNTVSPSTAALIKNLQQSLIALDRNRNILLNSLRSLLNMTNSIFLEATSPKRNRKAILDDVYTIPLKNLISSVTSKIKVVPLIKPALLKKVKSSVSHIEESTSDA